jgi:hypothetical protein
MEDMSDKIPKTRVKCYMAKDNQNIKENEHYYVKLDEAYGFNCGDTVIILRCSDFPEVIDINTLSELRKKIELYTNYAKRVKELKQKLESAENSYKEQLNELKVNHEIEITKLKEISLN